MFVTSVDLLEFVPEAEVTPAGDRPAANGRSDRRRRATCRVILHVPSRRGTKGTELILAGLDRLRADGVAFDLRLLEGVSHAEARAAIQDADIVVDNVLTGDYEVVSIEAMASSRVAVANVQAAAAEAYPDAPVVERRPRHLRGPDARRSSRTRTSAGASARSVGRMSPGSTTHRSSPPSSLAAYEAPPAPGPSPVAPRLAQPRRQPDDRGARPPDRGARAGPGASPASGGRRSGSGSGWTPLGGIEPRSASRRREGVRFPDPLRVALRRFRADARRDPAEG